LVSSSEDPGLSSDSATPGMKPVPALQGPLRRGPV